MNIGWSKSQIVFNVDCCVNGRSVTSTAGVGLVLSFSVHCQGGILGYDICVYHFWFVFLPWGIPPQSDWSLSCDHGLDYAS